MMMFFRPFGMFAYGFRPIAFSFNGRYAYSFPGLNSCAYSRKRKDVNKRRSLSWSLANQMTYRFRESAE